MSKFLEDFRDYIKGTGKNVLRIAEIKGDGEPESLELQSVSRCQDVYSVAKAFAVTAVGFLVDEGKLSVDATITELLGEDCPEGYQPLWEKTTLDMVMRHHIGLPLGFLDIDGEDALSFGRDYLAYMMRYPLSKEPGLEHCYTDAAYYLVSRIVEKYAGKTMDNFLWERLFLPLEFYEAAWSHCPMGHAMGATGLYIRVEDMVKLGALYMYGGVWKGTRLLSEEWVNTVLTRGYELNYAGFSGCYGKGGMAGQMLLVVTKEQRVVAWQSYDGSSFTDLIKFAAEYHEDN